jgi:hypothetical protein
MDPSSSTLPIPLELIKIISDHIFIKAWNNHQTIHMWLIELRSTVDLWPIEHHWMHSFPNHIRLHRYEVERRWKNSYWCYMSRDLSTSHDIPRPSIDQELNELREKNTQ